MKNMALRDRAPDRPRAVTFDCWNTLLYDPDPDRSYGRRVEALVRAAAGLRAEVGEVEARAALDAAWRRHWLLWHEGVATGGRDMAAWALAELGAETPGRVEPLAAAFAEIALDAGIAALEGAGELLAELAAAGVRRALVCDTGFVSGAAVRRLLERAGLLAELEVLVFSDEAGVPKPHPRVFALALGGLGVAAAEALHVGDLLRTDVAGARGAGMGSVRLRDRFDDPSPLPEADLVVDTHAELGRALGL